MTQKYKYEEMLPEEFLAAVEKMPVFFVPTGLLEWHDNHLPLGQDSLKAHKLCLDIAERIGGGIVLPPNYYGRPGYSSYIGTLTFSEALMDLLFNELFGQLKKVGAKVIVLLTGHYGSLQRDLINRVTSYYMKENPEITIIAQPENEGITVNGETPGDHAGKWETSILMHYHPELVHMENFEIQTKRKKIYPNPPNDYYKEPEEWVWKEDLRETASPELGAVYAKTIIEYVAQRVQNALK